MMRAAPLYIGLVELVLLLGDVPLQYHIIGQAHGAYFVQKARIVAVPGRRPHPDPSGGPSPASAPAVCWQWRSISGILELRALYMAVMTFSDISESLPFSAAMRCCNKRWRLALVHPVALDGEHDDIGHPEDADVKERETAHEALAVEGGGVGDESAVQAGHHPEKAQKVDKSAVHEAQHEGAGKGEYQQEKPAEIAHISLLEKQGRCRPETPVLHPAPAPGWHCGRTERG